MAAPEHMHIANFQALLRGIWEARPSWYGAAGMVAIVNATLGQAVELRYKIVETLDTTEILRQWDADRDALNARIGLYVQTVTSGSEGITPQEEIERRVVKPILDGVFPASFGLPIVPRIAKRGLELQPDGTFKSFGDAYEAARLWNEAVEGYLVSEKIEDHEVLPTFVRQMLIAARKQYLEEAAPHEDPTVRDVVESKMDDAIEGAGNLIDKAVEAVTGFGLSALLWGVFGVAAIGGITYAVVKAKQK